MDNAWITIGVIIALVAVAIPIGATVLVSLASLREEAARSITGAAPGGITRMARRLLGFRADHMRVRDDVRFGHARRTVSDSGRQQTGRQPEPRQVDAEPRAGALV
jgi:hypothetical protein